MNAVPKPKANKYRNKKCEYNGIKFDSKKEMERYIYLKSQKEQGLIQDLVLQDKWLIIPQNGKERAAYYISDFSYRLTGHKEVIVEDVKGIRTPAYILKRKLMRHVHGIEVQEI